MAFKLGLIPAAGKATRWTGHIKELLPIGGGCCLIDHTVQAMVGGGVDAILVVTSGEKLPVLQGHLHGRYTLPIFYTIQRGNNDIWSAITEAFPFRPDWTLFAMPDTLYPVDVFKWLTKRPFELGVFETGQPERFGVLRDGAVVNKRPLEGDAFAAWGVLAWHKDVQTLWESNPPLDYTDAINLALANFYHSTRYMDFYHDMASFEDYQEWMRTNHE